MTWLIAKSFFFAYFTLSVAHKKVCLKNNAKRRCGQDNHHCTPLKKTGRKGSTGSPCVLQYIVCGFHDYIIKERKKREQLLSLYS